MRMRVRAAGRLLAIGALALLLSGCFRVNMDMVVSPENTVSGTAIIAVDKSLLELSGQNVDQLFKDMDLSDLPTNTTVKPYEEEGFVGQELTFDGVPLNDFTGSNTLSGAGEQLSIVRVGDEFHVTGQLDMSGEEFSSAGEIPAQFLESFEFRISITFPGAVKSATGDIDGHTVTWEPKIGEKNPIQAVASAIPSDESPLLLILLIVAGVLVVAAIAFLLLRSRRPSPAGIPVEGGALAPIEETAATAPPAPSSPIPPGEPAPLSEPAPASEPAPPVPPEVPGSAVPPEDEESPPPVPPVSG
jgi:hypothetical protein